MFNLFLQGFRLALVIILINTLIFIVPEFLSEEPLTLFLLFLFTGIGLNFALKIKKGDVNV